MKTIIITERERDFLEAITEYFLSESQIMGVPITTRKGYKIKEEEIKKLQEKVL